MDDIEVDKKVIAKFYKKDNKWGGGGIEQAGDNGFNKGDWEGISKSCVE